MILTVELQCQLPIGDVPPGAVAVSYTHLFQAGNAKNLSKDDKVRVAEAVKNAKRAVKSKDAAQMNEAAGQLETLLNEVGVHIDPNAEYHGSASYENPNNDFSDDAVDADFEKL